MITYNMPARDRTGKLSAPVIEAVANGAVSANVDADTIRLSFSTKKAADAFLRALGNPKALGVTQVEAEALQIELVDDPQD